MAAGAGNTVPTKAIETVVTTIAKVVMRANAGSRIAVGSKNSVAANGSVNIGGVVTTGAMAGTTTATGIAATTIKFWDKAQSVRAGKAWRLHRGRSSAILIFFVGAFCMNIGELVKGVATATSTSEAHAKAAITAVFDQVASAIAKGEEISIPGFGKFSVKDRPERSGRNPATGEAITIAASKKVSFTPAKGLKDKL